MNKSAVINKISKRTGIEKKKVANILEELKNVIVMAIQKGDIVNFCEFGKFYTKQRNERKYVSFQTGETFVVPQHLVPVLKFSKKFVDKF